MAKDTLIEDYSNTGKRLINGLSKPDIKELLELAKAVQEKPYRLDKSDEYVRKFDPDKMIALLKYVQGLEEKREGTILIPEWLFEEYKKAMARLRELEPSLWPEKAND